MTQPTELTEAEKQRLTRLVVERADELYVDTQDMTFVLHKAVNEILEQRLAAAQPLTLLDTTVVGLPVPDLTWHPTDAEDFKRTVSAFPSLTWEAKAVGSTQYVTAQHGPFSLTVFAPRRPALPEEPTYAAELLREVRDG